MLMKFKTVLAVASLALWIALPCAEAEAQTRLQAPIAPFEPPIPVDFDNSYTVHCVGSAFTVVWRTRSNRSVITHMSLDSAQPSAAQLARFNSWVGRLKGDLAVRAACDYTGAVITFLSLSDYDNKHEVQFTWEGAKDNLLLEPPAEAE
ncbi:MAG: hypothetical protein JWM65_3903 [Sphingomonas bacterium]|nr:hypothetical protein [Sphingomonas bacterium]